MDYKFSTTNIRSENTEQKARHTDEDTISFYSHRHHHHQQQRLTISFALDSNALHTHSL